MWTCLTHQVNGEIRGRRNQKASPPAEIRRLIGSFCRTGRANRIFSPSSESSNTSSNNHHPKHPVYTSASVSFHQGSFAHPSWEVPCAAAAKAIPKTRKEVATTTPVRRPMRSMRTPKKIIPKISPIRKEFDSRLLMVDDMPCLYLRRGQYQAASWDKKAWLWSLKGIRTGR